MLNTCFNVLQLRLHLFMELNLSLILPIHQIQPYTATKYVRGCRFKSWIFFFFHLFFKNALCSQVKGFGPHGLLVYRLCLPPDTPIIFIIFIFHLLFNLNPTQLMVKFLEPIFLINIFTHSLSFQNGLTCL